MGRVPKPAQVGPYAGQVIWHDKDRQAFAQHFLGVACRIEPEVLRSLVSPDAVSFAVDMVEQLERSGYDITYPGVDVEIRFVGATHSSNAGRSLHDHITAWQKRWHLTANWCGWSAFGTLFLAATTPTLPRALAPPNWGLEPENPTLTLPLPIFADLLVDGLITRRLPTSFNASEPLEDEFQRIMSQLEVMVLDEYKRKIKEWRAWGARLGTARAEHHFDWLARYQVMGESCADITRTLHPELDSRSEAFRNKKRGVEKAIKQTADIIWLPRRKQPPGRKRRDGTPRFGQTTQ